MPRDEGVSIDVDKVQWANISLMGIREKLRALCEDCAAVGASIDSRVLEQRGITRQLSRIWRDMGRLDENVTAVLRWADCSVRAYEDSERRTADEAAAWSDGLASAPEAGDAGTLLPHTARQE